MMRTKTLMPDELKDLQYPSNSLYYSGPSKIIETHVTNKEKDMKDEHWVDAIRPKLTARQKFQALNYMELDDESLEMVIKDVRREYERRQKERYDKAVQRQSDLELRKELQGE